MFIGLLALAVAYSAAQTSTVQTPPPVQDGLPPTWMDGQWMILVTTVAGIITTILGFMVQLYREGRNRAWELEDRRLAAEELKRETQEAAAVLKKETARTRDMLVKKIEENTQINVDALKQANHVSDKLARIDTIIDNVRTKDQLDHVAAVVDETKEVVSATKEDTEIIKDRLNHG